MTHGEKRNAAAPTHCAGSPIDLVFSFDTTGSMYSCLGEVRKNLETMINRILTDIPNIRIAVSAQNFIMLVVRSIAHNRITINIHSK